MKTARNCARETAKEQHADLGILKRFDRQSIQSHGGKIGEMWIVQNDRGTKEQCSAIELNGFIEVGLRWDALLLESVSKTDGKIVVL